VLARFFVIKFLGKCLVDKLVDKLVVFVISLMV